MIEYPEYVGVSIGSTAFNTKITFTTEPIPGVNDLTASPQNCIIDYYPQWYPYCPNPYPYYQQPYYYPVFVPQPVPSTENTGWICPKCNKVYSPLVKTCEDCSPKGSCGK